MAVDTEAPETERLRVVRWRSRMLQDLGMDEARADFFAHGPGDWHEAERLILNGCPPELVLEIL
jgi:hypothetical protein